MLPITATPYGDIIRVVTSLLCRFLALQADEESQSNSTK